MHAKSWPTQVSYMSNLYLNKLISSTYRFKITLI